MSFSIYTHDAWGSTSVGNFQTLEEARVAFNELRQDPWYQQDGTVKGLELVEETATGKGPRIEWFAFQ